MFHSYFKRKYDKVLTFNIVHFPNFEKSASLLLAPHLTVSKFNKRREALIRGNKVVTFNSHPATFLKEGLYNKHFLGEFTKTFRTVFYRIDRCF